MLKYLLLKIVEQERRNMSRICSVCGKGKLSGNTVSHSNRRAPRSYNANLQKINVKKADGTVAKEYVCARCIKSGKVERA
jgi:large subunit ribosomal protein L28